MTVTSAVVYLVCLILYLMAGLPLPEDLALGWLLIGTTLYALAVVYLHICRHWPLAGWALLGLQGLLGGGDAEGDVGQGDRPSSPPSVDLRAWSMATPSRSPASRREGGDVGSAVSRVPWRRSTSDWRARTRFLRLAPCRKSRFRTASCTP
jgi:hypothetical protein